MDWPQKLRFLALLALLPQTLTFAQPHTQSPSRLEFSDVLAKVRAASHSLKRARMLVDAAELSKGAVEQQSSPNMQLSNSLSWQESSTGMRQQHALTMSATLWDFGRQRAQELKSIAQVEVSQAQAKESDEVLTGKTARFFVSLAAAEVVLRLAQEQSKNAESKLQTITMSYKRGERPQTDVVKLKIEAGRAKLFATRAQDEYSALSTQFQLITQAESARVDPALEVLLKPMRERTENDWLAFLAQLEKKTIESPTLEKLQANEKVLQAEFESSTSDNYPQLGASASAQASGMLMPLKPDVLAQVNIQYSLPIGDARELKRSALRARINEIKIAQAEEKKTRRDKFIQSKIRLQGYTRTVQLQRIQIESLLEYQKLVRARYFGGRASLLELTTTEDDLLANRLEMARLQASIYLGAIDAAEALGEENIHAVF